MTKLEAWLEKIKKSNEFDAPYIDANKAIAVIEALKEEMEFAMKYYESCGDEAEPEFQLFQSFKKALAIDPDSLRRNSNKGEKL